MNKNRRQFFQVTATGAAAVAATTIQEKVAVAGDPFQPAEPGLAAKFFNKGQQHILPAWAFTRSRDASPTWFVSATPRPVKTATWAELSGAETHNPSVKPYELIGDAVPVGKVMHGTAVEWNGKIVGGNMKYENATWKPASSAWEAMRERVRPDEAAKDYGISDLGNWGKFGANNGADCKKSLVRCYKVEMFEKMFRILPNTGPTLLYTYQGMVPGPTFRFRHGMPAVVRFENKLQTETSIHHHGGHNPTHSDGFPSYYVLQGEARDYLYPNILPLRITDETTGTTEIDFGEGQSTTWYHDHGLDATAFNVSHGLSGFALWFDEFELELIRNGILPGFGVVVDENQKVVKQSISGFDPEIDGEQQKLASLWKDWKAKNSDSYWSKRHDLAIAEKPDIDEPRNEDVKKDKDPKVKTGIARFYREALTPYFNPYDLPIVLQDRIFNTDTGQLVYDSNGHNGYIGGTQLINGAPWPVYEVKSRKYRLRILDGSNSRIYRLRFLDSQTFGLQPNADGNLEPATIPETTLENNAMSFLRIGKDSWLFPTPQEKKSLILNMANRADLVVDFKAWFEAARAAGRLNAEGNAEYYLVNTMPQFDGRGPKTKLAEDAGDPTVFPLPFTLNPANPVVRNMVNARVIPAAFLAAGPLGQLTELNQPIGLVKFVITPDMGEGADATIDETTILRPRHPIDDDDVMAVREFVFERGKGAWMINSRFYDPTISNASTVVGIKGQNFKVPTGDATASPTKKPSLTYAEEWILKNGGGGWWHPIHIHLEGHQLISYEKDFEADGMVGADGILGARAQAQMAGLPAWTELVGKFGFDPLLATNIANKDVIRDLRDTLSGFVRISTLVEKRFELQSAIGALGASLSAAQLAELLSWTGSLSFASAATWFDSLSQQSRSVIGAWSLQKFYAKELVDAPALSILLNRPGSGAALYPLIAKKLTQDLAILPAQARRIFDALKALRLEWAGEIVGNHDTQALGPNTAVRIRMRFRTWTGPLVFHCHNVEHEDMRMMVNFEATMSGRVDQDNMHDPNIAPTKRTHGQDVTDLETNPYAVGEMPWEAIDGFPQYRWEEKPVPGTNVGEARDSLIKPRPSNK